MPAHATATALVKSLLLGPIVCLCLGPSALGGKSDVWERTTARAMLSVDERGQKPSAPPAVRSPVSVQTAAAAWVLSAHGGLGSAFSLRPSPTGIFEAPGWVCPKIVADQGRDAAASFRR